MSQRPMPDAMARALAGLKAACDELDARDAARTAPAAPVACPIFGNTPAPVAPPTAGLPPQLAAASAELARVLAAPPGPPTWPVVNTPAIQAALDAKAAAKPGRPTDIKPHQVVRLVRFVRLGDPVAIAAGKAGLSRQAAYRILAGQAEIAHHPAVEAAGVFLPALKAVRNLSKTRTAAERPPVGTKVATSALGPANGPAAETAPDQGEPGGAA